MTMFFLGFFCGILTVTVISWIIVDHDNNNDKNNLI